MGMNLTSERKKNRTSDEGRREKKIISPFKSTLFKHSFMLLAAVLLLYIYQTLGALSTLLPFIALASVRLYAGRDKVRQDIEIAWIQIQAATRKRSTRTKRGRR